MIRASVALLLLTAPAVAQGVSPGETPLGITEIVEQFGRACVKTLPEFSAAPDVLRDQGFVQNPATTTWFHQTLNLSFKLTPPKGGDQCSMVFVSKEDPDAIGLALAISSGGTTVYLDPDSALAKAHREDDVRFFFEAGANYQGDQYYHAILIAAGQ
jgi:hypothetical protein